MNYDIFIFAPTTGNSVIGIQYQVWQGGIAVDKSFDVFIPNLGDDESILEAYALSSATTWATMMGYAPFNPIQKWYTKSSTARTTSIITPSLVGTGATGTQISSTKDSTVRASVSTSTTVNIVSGAGGTSSVALKICSTNNATEASWTTVTSLESDQTISLAIALGSVQIVKGQLIADVPAGWYYKLTNNGTGTHSESVITGQQTIYG